MDLDLLGDLEVRQVERLEVRWNLWTPASIAQPRGTCDVELHLDQELGALAWHVYAPEPTGKVGEFLADGLRWLLARRVQR